MLKEKILKLRNYAKKLAKSNAKAKLLKFCMTTLLLTLFLTISINTNAVIPSGWRRINSGDLSKTFGTDLATLLKVDTDRTPIASSTSRLTFLNGSVYFDGADYYEFDRFFVEVSNAGVFVYAQSGDYSVNKQWYNASTGWADIFGGYTIGVDRNTTLSLNGEMSAFDWLLVKDGTGYLTYSVDLLPGSWADSEDVTSVDGLMYSLNDGISWNDINELPLQIDFINQIKFLNNSGVTSEFLIGGTASGTPIFTLNNGEESVNVTLSDDRTYYLGYILPAEEDMFFISGGYRFFKSFRVSGNYNYSIRFSLSFGLDTDIVFTTISINGGSSIGYRYLDYMNGQGHWYASVYESTRNLINTMVFNDNWPTTTRYITFQDQYVDRTTYEFLSASGEFGTFSPPSDDSIIGDFDFGSGLLQGVASFLNFEVFPNFSLLNLLQLTIAIPLLIYILKLFLGG